MKQLTCGSLFAGIGGFDLGFERAGIKTIWQVEIDEYCRRVLAKHFPDAERFGDIRECIEFQACDILAGGFPCTDISIAGRGAGITGPASGLWREMERAIRMVRPRIVVVENVAALLDDGMGTVCGDLAAIGHSAEWDCLPASAFGAPHERDRVFIVAYATSDRQPRPGTYRQPVHKAPDAFREADSLVAYVQRENLPYVRGRHDGFSAELDEAALFALGNAIVPQIAEWIGRRILEAETSLTNGER